MPAWGGGQQPNMLSNQGESSHNLRWKTKRSQVWKMAAACRTNSGLMFFALWITRLVILAESLDCSTPWSNACFNRSRCLGLDGSQKLSIYPHDLDCTRAPSVEIMERKEPIREGHNLNAVLKTFRELALERELLAEKIEDACIIVYAFRRTQICVENTPEWDMGRNHLLFSFNDQPRDDYVDLKNSAAMWAQSNMQSRYFRYGYDISVPLPPKGEFEFLGSVSPTHRKYFATFKGALYPSGSGEEERKAIQQLRISANSSDVVIVEKCFELHEEHLLPENLEPCRNLKEEYNRQDYGDLMNTTFALIPAGRSPATFRLGEALSAGAIPVFLHKGYVKPFPDRISWRLFSFSFSLEDTSIVIDTLRNVPEEELLFMQGMVLQVYEDYFNHGFEGIVRPVIETLENRLAFHPERE